MIGLMQALAVLYVYVSLIISGRFLFYLEHDILIVVTVTSFYNFLAGSGCFELCVHFFFRDLSENQLVGPIPPILGNLSYTGKL